MLRGHVVGFERDQVFISHPPAQKHCFEMALVEGFVGSANG